MKQHTKLHEQQSPRILVRGFFLEHRGGTCYRLCMGSFSSHLRRGFTLIEMLLVVSIIVLMISMLLPALSRAREVAKRGVCANNLYQMYTASIDFAVANSRRFPPRPRAWSQFHIANFDPSSNTDSYAMGFKLLVDAKHIDPSSLFCPSDKKWNVREHFPQLTFGAAWKPYLSSYAQREEFAATDHFNMKHAQSRAAYTSDWFTTAIPANPFAMHGDGWNVGFFDGSVSWTARTEAIWAGITWSNDFTGQGQTWRRLDR